MATQRHVPALDGVRGLAVLTVIAFHANGALTGGYLGVDLFFVLSGYLITGLLVQERARAGRIDLAGFWVRRARRLLPAVLVLIAFVALYARFLAKADEVGGLRKDALATLAYIANWRAIYAGKSYWEMFAAPSPLEHMWSLAIEEQFYVFWPILVVGVGRRLRPVLAVLAVASIGAALLLYDPAHTSRVYMGTDTRAIAILLGAALSTFVPLHNTVARPRLLDGAALIATLVLVVAYVRLDGQSPLLYRGGFWVTELCSLVVITAAVTRGTLAAKVLAFRPLAFVGTISYGLYLWHWPVDCILTPERVHVGKLALNALRLLVTFAIALASFYLIEQPIRRRGVRHVLVGPAAFAAVVALLVVGTRTRTPATNAQVPRIFAQWPGPRDLPNEDLPDASRLPPGTTRILVLGDSVAQYLGNAMRLEQEEAHAFVAQRGVGSCSIHDAEPTVVNGQEVPGTGCASAWELDVAALRPDVTLIVLGGGFLGPHTCEPDWRERYNARLSFLLDRIKGAAGQVIVTLVPYPGERWRSKNTIQSVECFNDELARVAKAHGRQTLDLMTHVCPTTDCVLTSNGAPVRNDGLHFDGPGAAETAQWTLHRIEALRTVD